MRYFVSSLLFCLFLATSIQTGSINMRVVDTSISLLDSNLASTTLGSEQQAPQPDIADPALHYARGLASQFLYSTQLSPEYGVICEFLPEQNSARHYKNLINPDDEAPWYVSQDVSKNLNRLSGWKESNQLFVERNNRLS